MVGAFLVGTLNVTCLATLDAAGESKLGWRGRLPDLETASLLVADAVAL